MFHRISIFFSPTIAGALAGLGVAMAATPAPGQTVEELTVTGRYGPDGQPRSLSQAVSYADLDLRLKADRDELNHRIDVTARYLCEELGEASATSSVAPSCRDAAVKDARAQAQMVVGQAPPRPSGWTRGPAWVPPSAKGR